MGHRFQFQQAVDLHTKLSEARHADDVYDLREAMEKIILDYCPSNAREAAAVIDVLLVNVDAGPRIDGRDVRALSNLQRWCASVVEGEPMTSESDSDDRAATA